MKFAIICLVCVIVIILSYHPRLDIIKEGNVYKVILWYDTCNEDGIIKRNYKKLFKIKV